MAAEDRFAYYRRLLTRAVGKKSLEGLEAIEPVLDLSNGALTDRLDLTRQQLDQLIKNVLSGDPTAVQLGEEILRRGDLALRMLRDGDEKLFSEHREEDLEVIARTDGSRPSFVIRNGEIDRASSPVGDWGVTLDVSAGALAEALSCVGRINDPTRRAGWAGTGFLVARDLVLTNRHVLQEVADLVDGEWRLHAGVAIDFGHEFRGRASISPRAVTRVVFVGPDHIDPQRVVHTKLDLALIELAPLPATEPRPRTLPLDIAPDWAEAGQLVFIIGYPGRPSSGVYNPTLLEQLFQSTFGYKRLAPGAVARPGVAEPGKWTLAHDATTLGGNSGSVVVVVGRERNAAGLHYGGTTASLRENWGHVLGLALDTVDTRKSVDKPLREVLAAREVILVDRVAGPG